MAIPNEEKKMSKCCAEPVREVWGTKLLITKGNIQRATRCFYQCSHCGQPADVSYLIRNQYGVWETDKRNGRPEKEVNLGGRPSELTSEAVSKLKEAFSYDCSVVEICRYVGISRQTFYNWKEKNPELFDSLEEMRAEPLLRARKTVVEALGTNTDAAFKYLERKSKEFIPQLKTEQHIVETKERDLSLEEMLKKATPEQREKILNGINELHASGN